MAEVSLIVPIYNVEKYLPQCLDSLRGQSLRDIEILCVVDGATDRSGLIADLFASVDDRIRVIHKPNGGLSSARNAGIRAATGRILCFVDSDDMLAPKACETIVAAFAKNNADVVTFGAECWPPFHDNPWMHDVLSPRDVDYDGFDIDILMKEKSRPFVWRTALRSDFLSETGILFDEEVLFGEDQVFHFAIYPRARRVSFISDKLYRYRADRQGSLMDSRDGNLLRKFKEHVSIAETITADWSAQGYLGDYGRDLLAWSIDFLVPPLDNLDVEKRKEVFPLVAAYWSRWFGEDASSRFGLDAPSAALMSLVGKGDAANESFSVAVKAFHEAQGAPVREPMGVRIRRAVKKVLPLPASVAEARLGDLGNRMDWYVEDAAACTQSLALLEAEMRAMRMADPESGQSA